VTNSVVVSTYLLSSFWPLVAPKEKVAQSIQQKVSEAIPKIQDLPRLAQAWAWKLHDYQKEYSVKIFDFLEGKANPTPEPQEVIQPDVYSLSSRLASASTSTFLLYASAYLRLSIVCFLLPYLLEDLQQLHSYSTGNLLQEGEASAYLFSALQSIVLGSIINNIEIYSLVGK